eukprot:TRINITY_DN15743_c0_g1_i3.p1 TRINITY_DN15743_c0_g1~~TRINITY_DN15743_c0_g1_i3.p1  ORF type:complete len:1136 (-),score=257.67 TRINITY_DN15743_c0_g1_i3:63-3470(-)
MSGGISAILPALADRDTKERMAGVSKLDQHLQRNGVDDCSQEGSLVDALVGLLGDNNFKVCQTALSCLELVVEHLDNRFRTHFNVVLGSLVERLGDNKAVVRAKALDVLNCIVRVLSPAACIDKIIPLLGHKNARVREQTLFSLCNTLDEFGPESVSLPKILPHLVKRLDDSQKDVRLAAISALEEWYRFVGGPLRNELSRRDIRPAILKMLFERFDEVEAGGHVETNLSRVSSVESSLGSAPATPVSTRSTSSNLEVTARPANVTTSTPRTSGPGSARKSTASSPRSDSSSGVTLWWDQGIEGCCLATCSGEVAPKQVYSDKELSKEMVTVTSGLASGIEGDWNDRMKSMKHLQRLVLGGCGEFAVWPSQLRDLKDQLGSQLTDLRSAIIRDACATIALISSCCPDVLEQYVECLLEGMLKLTNQSIAVIAMAGVQGTRSVVNSCVSPRCVSKILEICAVKAPAHRRRAVEILAQILETYPASILERYVDTLMAAVRKYVSDRDMRVRSAGRVCFFAFCALWEDRGRDLFQTVDPSMQRVLTEEESTYEPGALGRELATGTRSSNIGSGASTPTSRAQSTTKSKPKRKDTSARPKPGRPPMMERQRSAELPAERPKPSTAGARATSVGRGRANSTPVPKEQEAEQPRARANTSQSQRINGSTMVSPRGPKQSARPSSQPEYEFVSGAANGRSGSQGGHARAAPRVVEAPRAAPRVVEPAPQPAAAPEDNRSLMGMAEHQDWSVRAQAFSQLHERIGNERHTTQVLADLHALARLHIQHLTDPHYRVCLAVLSGLDKLVEHHPDAMEGYTERMLPRLVQKVLDPKEMVRQRAEEVTELLLGTVSADTTIPLLLRMLEGSNPRLRVAALQWLTQLVLDGQFNSAHMKICFSKAAPHAGDKSTELRHAVADIVQAFYELEPLVLFRLIHQLPAQLQQDVKQLMSPVLPQFEGQLAMHRARENSHNADPPREERPQVSARPASTARAPKPAPPQAADDGYHPGLYSPPVAEKPKPAPVQEKPKKQQQQPQEQTYSAASDGASTAVSASMVPSLLSDMSSSSPQRRKDSLHKIIRLCRSGTSWVSYFGQILLVVLEALCDAEPVIRELSLVVIKEMLRSQPTSFVDLSLIHISEPTRPY